MAGVTLIRHPLKEGTNIRATIEKCKCTGGGTQTTFGRIIKTYKVPNGIYYQLQNGLTIKDTQVQEVLP